MLIGILAVSVVSFNIPQAHAWQHRMKIYSKAPGWGATIWNVLAVGPPYCYPDGYGCPVPSSGPYGQNYVSRGGYFMENMDTVFVHDFDGGSDNGRAYAKSAWATLRLQGMVDCDVGGHFGPPCNDCQCCGYQRVYRITVDGADVPYSGCGSSNSCQGVNTGENAKIRTPDGKVYVIKSGQKRWITTEDILNRCYGGWSGVQDVSWDCANTIPTGPNADDCQPQYYVCTYVNPGNIGGGFYLGGTWYSNGQRASIAADGRSYTLTAGSASGYQFSSWSTVRSVYVTNPTSSSTTVSFGTSGWDGTCVGGLTLNYQPQQQFYTITVNTSPGGLDSPYGGGTYAQGTSITIGVGTASGYTFQYWTRDGVVYTYSMSFSYAVDGPHTFTAFFSQVQQAIITVNTSPAGLDSPYGGGTYSVGTVITIGGGTASGYTFQYWLRDGGVYSYSMSFTYTVDASHTFTAVFQQNPCSGVNLGENAKIRDTSNGRVYVIKSGQKRWITSEDLLNRCYGGWSRVQDVSAACANSIPTGPNADDCMYNYAVTVSGLGSGVYTTLYLDGGSTTNLYNGGSYTYWNLQGTHTISVLQYTTYGAPANTRYHATIYSITASAAGSYTFTYHAEYTLTMAVNPSGAGTTSPSVGTNWYDYGQSVTISASAASGYVFQSWTGSGSGAYSGTLNPASIAIYGPITETANFEKRYTITVNTNPSGLDSPYGGGTYAAGSWITIGVNEPSCYQFSHWDRDGVDYAYSMSFSYQVDASHTFTAVFQPRWQTITVNTDPSGLDSPSGGGSYACGTSITISVSSVSGYQFKYWLRDGSIYSYSQSFQCPVDAPRTFTAVFRYSYTVTVNGLGSGASTTLYLDGSSPKTLYNGQSLSYPDLYGGHTISVDQYTSSGAPAGTRYHAATYSTYVTGQGSTTFTYHAEYSLTMAVNPPGAGTTSPAAGSYWYDAGSPVTLSEYPASGYTWQNWAGTGSGSYSGTNPSPTIVMNAPIMETANFQGRTLDRFAFSSINSPQVSGQPFSVTITAVDQYGNIVTGYTGTNTLSSSKGTITPTSITFTGGQWGGSVTITVTSAQTGVTITTSGSGKTGTSNSFNVDVSGALDHFDFNTITSPQTAGAAFTITVTAKDSAGRTVTSYAGTNTLSASTGIGTISPTSIMFTGGVSTGSVTITKAQTGVTITTAGGGKQGTSNSFNVNPGPLDHFVFDPISSPQSVGVAFTIKVTAVDQNENIVTSYAGTNTLSASTGSGTINPPTTGAFASGVWTGSVKITKTQNSVTITTTGSSKTGTSNSFDVTVGALDHFAFDSIGPQTAGVAFTIKIIAVDAAGNVVTSYSGSNTLTDTTVTITPTATGSFTAGVWTGSVIITKAQTDVTITTNGGGKTGTSNSFTVSSTVSFDFIITASPLSEQVGRGDSLPISVTALLVRGTGDAVNLAVSGAPPAMQTSFDTQSGTPTFIATLTITPSTSTPLGRYMLTVSATAAGGLTRSVLLDIEVTRTTPKNFMVRVYPPGAVLLQGGSTSMTAAVTFRGGYSEPVTLSSPNLPSGISVSCSPNSGSSSFQASCTVTTQASINPSEYIIEVMGTGGDGQAKSAYFLLLVEPAPPGGFPTNPDYTVTANPSALTATIPVTGTWDTQLSVYVYSLTHFNQQVSFTLSGQPNGVTGTFTPSSVTPPPNGRETSTLKLTVASTAGAGTYKVKITGTSGSLTRTAELILILRPASQEQAQALYVDILQPANGATVSGMFPLTANCTDLTYGPGNVNATYQISSSTWSSQWMAMIPPKNGGSIWTVSVDTVAMQLSNGDYTITVKATRLNDPTASSTDSIIVRLDNSAVVHKDTFIINYPQAASLHGDGDTYNPSWWFEEDHFMPGETMGVRIDTGTWAGRNDVKINIIIDPSLIYAPLSSKYPATRTITGTISRYVTAVFPFDFSKTGIYRQWQVTVEVRDAATGTLLGNIPLANDGTFRIEGPDADWYTVQHLDHASVVAALKWSTSAAVLHRTGTIGVSSTISSTKVSGVINDAGAIVAWVPYQDWYGHPVFTVTYAGSNVKVMRDATSPLEKTFTYDVLAVSYTVTGQDYTETVNLEFFARYQTDGGQHPAVDTYVALQVSTDQPWLKAQTVGGTAQVPITASNPDGTKPLSWTVRVWTYAVKFTSPDGNPPIFANQWANLEVDREHFTATVTVDGITRQTGGLSVDASVASSAMWLDMNSVEAKVVVRNQAGQIVAQQTYAITILHGQANHYTWLVNGDFAPGTYTIEVTLTYGIPSPPVTIGTTTQQLAAG
jgi:hypothetical protein